MGVDHGPHEISLVPSPAFTAFHSPYAGESFEAAYPDSSPLPWPSPLVEWLGSLWVPFGLVNDAAGFPLWYGLLL